MLLTGLGLSAPHKDIAGTGDRQAAGLDTGSGTGWSPIA